MNAPRSMPVVPSQTRCEMIAAHLAGDDPQHRAALGDLDAHQLLDRQRQADVVRHRRQVVGAVGERHDLVVLPVLAQLLEARVQVTDVRDAAPHRLAVELEHQPEHAVRRGVLRPDVDQHVLGAEGLVEMARHLEFAGVLQLHAERHRDRPPAGIEPGGAERDVDRARAHSTKPRLPCFSRSRTSGGRFWYPSAIDSSSRE